MKRCREVVITSLLLNQLNVPFAFLLLLLLLCLWLLACGTFFLEPITMDFDINHYQRHQNHPGRVSVRALSPPIPKSSSPSPTSSKGSLILFRLMSHLLRVSSSEDVEILLHLTSLHLVSRRSSAAKPTFMWFCFRRNPNDRLPRELRHKHFSNSFHGNSDSVETDHRVHRGGRQFLITTMFWPITAHSLLPLPMLGT